MEMLAGGDIDKEKIVGQGKYPVIANALTNDGIVGFYEHDYREIPCANKVIFSLADSERSIYAR